MSGPAQALIALAKERPDPRAVSSWIVAYLGKRSPKDQRTVLQSLAAEFDPSRASPADARAYGLIFRVVQQLQEKMK